MYHRIDAHTPTLPEITHRLTVTPQTFARQIAWLHDHGYHAITQRELFDALVHGKHLDARPVLITFDDGYRDVFGQASEALARLGMHATAYVITGRISGRDPSFLTWSLLRNLERRGIEIGSHTVSHVDLTQLSDAVLSRELRESRGTLERGLGHPVQWLSYPFGRVDDRVAAAAREAGYVLAMTTAPGRTQHSGCALELRRLRILDSTTLDELEWMLTAGAGRISAGC
jgi:peptidoglycan/xylan/chitin deacetylase (PgdA/CDA1 family)